MKNYIPIFLLLFLYQSSAAQNANKIIPPSPEAAALAKFADVPVSPFTGIPDINIPLHEMSCGSLKLPVSVSYYAAGITVEDVPTWVGLGWTLNAGGVITRTIRGKAEGVRPDGTVFPVVAGLPVNYVYPGEDAYYKVKNFALGADETEPDAFYYNFAGRTGTFYFNSQGLPVLKKSEDIKIEYLYVATNLTKFVITLEDGTKYYFEDTDQAVANADISTWYLTRIVDPNGISSITFQYVTEQYNIDHPSRPDKYYYFSSLSSGPIYLGQYLDLACAKRFHTNKRLELITASSGETIQFIPKTNVRTDVETSNARALDEIAVKDYTGKIAKRYKFVNNTIRTIKPFTTPVLGYECADPTDEYVNNRLYLDEIKVLSAAGNALPFYKFKYAGRTPDGKDSLPHRVSFAQDWGGYYNGQDGNTDLIPTFNDRLQPDPPSATANCLNENYPRGIVFIPASDRSMNLRYKKLGTLTTIIHATSGYTEFEYGTNPPGYQNYTYGGLRVDAVKYFDNNGRQVKKKNYEYSLPCLGYTIEFTGYSYYNPTFGDLTPFFVCQGPSSPYYVALRVSSGPLNDLGTFEGPIIGYQSVKEIEENNGYTVYNYSGNCISEGQSASLEVVAELGLNYNPYYNFTVQGFYWPFTINLDESWKRGILLNRAVYSQSNVKLSETDYTYSFLEVGSIPAIKVYTARPDQVYIYRQFHYPITWNRLDMVKETQYDGARSLAITKEYQYSSMFHKQVTKETISGSNNVKRSTVYKYAPDYTVTAASPMKMLQDKHMVREKIETQQLINETGTENQIGGSINLYSSNGSIVRPSQQLQSESTSPFTPTASSFNNTTGQLTYHSSYKPSVYFDGYDDKGNLTQYHLANDANTVFLWGYNKTQPVAKVTNAGLNQVFYNSFEDDGVVFKDANGENLARTGVKVLNAATYTIPATFNPPAGTAYKMSYWYYNGNTWIFSGEQDFVRNISVTGSRIDEIRVYPAQSLMNTYTYDPLYGITSECGSDNKIVYYEYDEFGRLKTIRNSEREIIKTYTYNYKQ